MKILLILTLAWIFANLIGLGIRYLVEGYVKWKDFLKSLLITGIVVSICVGFSYLIKLLVV